MKHWRHNKLNNYNNFFFNIKLVSWIIYWVARYFVLTIICLNNNISSDVLLMRNVNLDILLSWYVSNK